MDVITQNYTHLYFIPCFVEPFHHNIDSIKSCRIYNLVNESIIQGKSSVVCY